MIDPLDLVVRRRIFEFVRANPGVHFRAVGRALRLGVGALDYHVRILEGLGLLRTEKRRGKLYIFSANTKKDESALLPTLRTARVRRIALYLLEHGRATHGTIARDMNLSKGTLSFHLARMREGGMIVEQRLPGKTIISLANPESLARLLVTYRATFVDELVDSFVDMWSAR